MTAQSRLGDSQSGRRFGKAPIFGDRGEVSQLAKVHAVKTPFCNKILPDMRR